MCQANLQPRVGRERQKVSGQFMKSDRLAGGDVESGGRRTGAATKERTL